MKTSVGNHPIFGEMLLLEHGKLTVGIPLAFGIRIAYLSYDKSENLFFEQPNDMTDLTTKEGWRIRGGHRLWVAPEKPQTYFPDNQPISYEITDNEVILTQAVDPWLNVRKSIKLSFLSDNEIQVTHVLQNTSDKPRCCSVWGVTAMAPGGVENIPLPQVVGAFHPVHKVTSWCYTNLGDPRAQYCANHITLSHAQGPTNYKIGVGHPAGPITYTNQGVVFEKQSPLYTDKAYPDGDVSYETFMCNHMVEVESLSPLYNLQSGETATHTEIWKCYPA